MANILNSVKAQAGKIHRNINELYTLALMSFGLPALVYIYLDWRAALSAFIVIQIALGLIRERK